MKTGERTKDDLRGTNGERTEPGLRAGAQWHHHESPALQAINDGLMRGRLLRSQERLEQIEKKLGTEAKRIADETKGLSGAEQERQRRELFQDEARRNGRQS